MQFPASLVISKKAILRWQFLQRPLVHLKALEAGLSALWLVHSETIWREKLNAFPALESWKRRVFRLRHRMLYFIQSMIAFITAEVLEPNWKNLEEKLENAKTVDGLMQDHFNFLNVCRKECMLTDTRLVEVSSRLSRWTKPNGADACVFARPVYTRLQFLHKLTQTAGVFVDKHYQLVDQLTMERSNYLAAREAGEESSGAAAMTNDLVPFLHKYEKSWESRLRVRGAAGGRTKPEMSWQSTPAHLCPSATLCISSFSQNFKDVVSLLASTENPAAQPLMQRLINA